MLKLLTSIKEVSSYWYLTNTEYIRGQSTLRTFKVNLILLAKCLKKTITLNWIVLSYFNLVRFSRAFLSTNITSVLLYVFFRHKALLGTYSPLEICNCECKQKQVCFINQCNYEEHVPQNAEYKMLNEVERKCSILDDLFYCNCYW